MNMDMVYAQILDAFSFWAEQVDYRVGQRLDLPEGVSRMEIVAGCH